MTLNLIQPRRSTALSCGLAIIVAGSATAAKAQCAAQSTGATTAATTAATGTTAAALTNVGTLGLTAASLQSFQPVVGQSQSFGIDVTALASSNQRMLQMRAAANQQALARKLAVMRKQAIAKKQARDAAGETLPSKTVRKVEMTESQRDASQRYWLAMAALQPGVGSR